jgi:hypothetical protein
MELQMRLQLHGKMNRREKKAKFRNLNAEQLVAFTRSLERAVKVEDLQSPAARGASPAKSNPGTWLSASRPEITAGPAELFQIDFVKFWKLCYQALLWHIYSRRCSLQIHFRQCGRRCGGSRAKSSRIAWRTAGKVG